MTLELIVRPEVEAEMAEAFDWCEARVPGLGSEFLLNVDATMNAILRNPRQYPMAHKNLRRALTRRFPYQVHSRKEAYRRACRISCQAQS